MVAHLILVVLAVMLVLLIPNKKKALIWSMGVITVFLAIRYDWGNDYMEYLNYFKELSTNRLNLFDITSYNSSYTRNNEFGWVILNRIFDRIGLGFFGMVIILTIFENWIIYHMIAKYVKPRYYWVAILFYVFTTSFCVFASMMRQFLCICLYLIVVDLMCDKKVRGYIFWSIGIILLGSTFHRANIVMLVTLPLFYIYFKEGHYNWWILSILTIAYFVWTSSIGPRIVDNYALLFLDSSEDYQYYSRYINDQTIKESKFGFAEVYRILLFIIWMLIIPQVKKEKQPIILLGLFAYFFEPITAAIPLASRLVMYMSVTDMIRWSSLVEVWNNKKYLIISLLLITIYSSITTVTSFYNNEIWTEKFFHFHTIFEAGQWM